MRIEGVDVTRGLAVLGMFAAHLGSAGSDYPPTELGQVVDGRSAATFAVLAGVSTALLSGGSTPDDGARMRRSRIRVLTRAALLFLLHWPLYALGTPVLVILASYGLMLAATAPLLRVRPAWLFGGAALVTVVAAPVVLLLRPEVAPGPPLEIIADPLLTGAYPAVVWIAYVLVGLGVGRLGLSVARTQWAVLAVGAGLAVVGYGVPLLAGWGLTGDPTRDLLLTVEPHSDTTPELVGNIGFALLVLGVCLRLSHVRWAPVRWVLHPFAATGAMALTVYVAHIVLIAVLGDDAVHEPEPAVLVTLVGVTLVVATLWRRWLGRGPLERLLHAVSMLVALTAVPLTEDEASRAASTTGTVR